MSVNGVGGVARLQYGDADDAQARATAESLLPEPNGALAAAADDVLVALAIAMVKQKQEDRAAGDRCMQNGAKAQEAAHARKIEAMHELADDILMEGIVSASLDGASAVASGASATTQYSGQMTELRAGERTQESIALTRNAGLLEATSKAASASSKFSGSICKSSQELDRSESAEADAAKDSAKASVDAASSAISRAQEDIRATISALRQLMSAKTQLANAAILRG